MIGVTAAAMLLGSLSALAQPETICELTLEPRRRPSSASCLSCHDGSIAPDVPHAFGPGGDSANGAHPVEVDQASSAISSAGSIAFPAELPPALQLVNGKVACVTCHDGSSTLPFKTAMPMAGSQLCFACHRL